MEVRTVAPDANPYLCIYGLLKAGLSGIRAGDAELKKMEEMYSKPVEKLPGNIYDSLDCFNGSDFVKKMMGADNQKKYAALKQMVADRSPRALGGRVKGGEILFHHEVTNQLIWGEF